jgi:hypothetical protein
MNATLRGLFSHMGNRRVSPWLLLGGALLVSLAAYLALIPVPRADGQLIGSDGVGYYVHLRSLVLDGDLDYTNEYHYYREAFNTQSMTAAGRPANKHAVGPALLWLPFFLVAHVLALLIHTLYPAVAPDGYGYLYQAAISIGSIVYGALGFALAYRCAAQIFSRTAAVGSVLLLWFASNAIYYMVIEPSMAHMVSLFSVSLLLSCWFFWLRRAQRPLLLWQAALLGAAGGLVPLVRLQDTFLLLLPYGTLAVYMLWAWQAGEYGQARAWLRAGVVAASCTVLVFVPQLIAWQQIYGTWLEIPYLSNHGSASHSSGPNMAEASNLSNRNQNSAFNWLNPKIAEVLFLPFRGLFIWHPVYLLATIGLLVLARRDRSMALLLAFLLALNIYIVASWWGWAQGDSFGGRMFLNTMWIWVLGLAGLFEWLREHVRPAFHRPLLALALLLVVWNGLALVQYRLGLVPMDAPLTWEQITLDRLRLPWLLLQRS